MYATEIEKEIQKNKDKQTNTVLIEQMSQEILQLKI